MNNVPDQVVDVLNKIKEGFAEILGTNLVGIYIHGSIAMGCFNPKSSDIDVLVVVKEKLDIEIKKKIVSLLLELSDLTPDNGVEMSIVLYDSLKQIQYPTPFELYYSYEQKQDYLDDKIDLTKNESDSYLIGHLVIAREHGICLVGKPTSEVIPEIPRKLYLRSIIKDSMWSINNISKGPDVGTCSVPTYGVLNLCRVLAYIDDNFVTSKAEGGEWGLKKLPKKYHSVIQQAVNKYTDAGKVEPVDAKTLKEFSQYALSRFKELEIDEDSSV